MPPIASETKKPTPPTSPTSRLGHTLGIHTAIRKEKSPPIGLYCMLLALANLAKASTGYEIGRMMGDETAPNGTITSALRNGYITQSRAVGPGGNPADHFALTPKGVAEVQRLMNPNPH